jgi:hypothetical protein
MAGKAQIESILTELQNIPLARVSYNEVEYKSLPPIPAKALKLYEPDYLTSKELRDKIKADTAKYALRKAFFDIAEMMRKTSDLDTVKTFPNTGPIAAKVKDQFKRLQERPGQIIFEMENVLNEAVKAGDKREEEVSPRWQANYDFAMARFKSRLILIYEYNNVLAQIRGENLPEIDPKIHNGWRVGAAQKPQVRDVPKVKQYAKDIAKIWKKVAEDHPDTPWAVLAQRESLYALGLEWRPSRD